jgi:hypothetical protein
VELAHAFPRDFWVFFERERDGGSSVAGDQAVRDAKGKLKQRYLAWCTFWKKQSTSPFGQFPNFGEHAAGNKEVLNSRHNLK